MIYNTFQDIRLSALGFGAMRLPVIDGDDSRIDETAALRMVDTAMENGINYYDTAWGYHGENSELVMGKALARYPRESFYLATKFPGYDPANWSKVEEIFEAQLKKLNVKYFDSHLQLFDGTKAQRPHQASGVLLPWEHTCSQAFSGCLRQGYGILSASAELSGLDFPAWQRKGGSAE